MNASGVRSLGWKRVERAAGRPDQERRRRFDAGRARRLLVGWRTCRSAAAPASVCFEAGVRGKAVDEVVGGVAGVLGALALVGEPDELPHAVLRRRRGRHARQAIGVGAEEAEQPQLEPHLAGAHVAVEERREARSAWYSAQNGHWRSANSTIVTGAFGEPSVMPDCGMPSSADSACAGVGPPLARRRSELVACRVRRRSRPARRSPPVRRADRGASSWRSGHGSHGHPIGRTGPNFMRSSGGVPRSPHQRMPRRARAEPPSEACRPRP